MNEPLDPPLKALLKEDVDVPMPADMHARLESFVKALPQPVLPKHSAPSEAAPGVVLSKTTLASLLVTAALAGGVTGVALERVRTRPVEKASVQEAPPGVVEAPTAVPGPQVPAIEPAKPRAKAPRPSDEAMEAERNLLEQARVALSHSDFPACEAALDRSRRIYPSGSLREERDFLWIMLEKQRGNVEEMHRRAAAFRRDYPTSLLRASLPSGDSR